MVIPRFCIVPPSASSRAEEALEFCRSVGLELDEHQEFVLSKALGVAEDGRWAAEEVGLTSARRNGKTRIVVARHLAALYLFDEKYVSHSAHELRSAFECFLELLEVIEASEELSRHVKRVRRQTGHEGIDFVSGQRIRYVARSKKAGRGLAGNLCTFDEAHTLPESVLAAQVPMLGTEVGQLWYVGSAPDKTIHEHALVFSQVRARALSGASERLLYVEWSAEPPKDGEGVELLPGDLPPEFLDDELQLRAANPAFPERLTPAAIALERRAMSARSFAVERLSVGDRPTSALAETGPISGALWEELRDESSKPLEPLTIAIDINPAGRASFSGSGNTEDDFVHVGCAKSDLQVTGVDLESGHGLYHELREFGKDYRVARVLIDERVLRSPIRELIEDATFERVEPVDTAGMARSCSTFLALANERRLRHVGDPRLSDSLKDAAVRSYHDGFLWNRRDARSDPAPVISATIAAAAVVHEDVPVSAGGLGIFAAPLRPEATPLGMFRESGVDWSSLSSVTPTHGDLNIERLESHGITANDQA
jgi:hypothetical protein